MMSKTKAIAIVVIANLVFWGGLAVCYQLASNNDFFKVLCIFYVEAWVVIGLSTYGLYKLIRSL